MRRSTRQLAAWIAGFAILFGALAPTVARAMAAWSGGGAAWTEICTSAGLVRAAVPAGDEAPADSGSGRSRFGGIDCPYCLHHADSLPAPAAARVFVAAEACSQHAPPAAWRQPRPIHAWASAQPRAPPLVS
jgi:hypothetical protein